MADISIILYDASLQSAVEFPENFLRHKAIQNDAAREGCPAEQLIVDIARHYPAIRELESSTRLKIGRPDLVHVSLLTMLHHPLMTVNPHRAYVQTIGDNWFSVPSDWRIPVNYIRFMGLMRQLFFSRRVPDSKKPILELKKGNLGELIEIEGLSGRKILLSSTGDLIAAEDLAANISKSGGILIVGGFQKGEPSKMAIDVADEVCSISPQELSSWTTISLLMTALLSHKR